MSDGQNRKPEDCSATPHDGTFNSDVRNTMRHFGYEKLAEWFGLWDNTPERLAQLKSGGNALFVPFDVFGLDKKYHLSFDYDPDYPWMLIQLTVTNPNR